LSPLTRSWLSRPGDKMLLSTVRKVFRTYGEFCAKQPWEVIVATLTFLVCILTVMGRHSEHSWNVLTNSTKAGTEAGRGLAGGQGVMELAMMTAIRCVALLHCYYQFKKVHRLGSPLIMKMTMAYLVFASVLFCLIVFGVVGPEFENVKESWFLIMLLIDIPKVTRLAQFALTSSHQRRISENLAVGMAHLGPVMSFETLGKVLLVGLCGLTGYKRLELLSTYGLLTIIVNFLLFMTFFPAGLSLVLELMFSRTGRPQWEVKQILKMLPSEDQQSNVVYRVRLIGITCLVIVHTLCRWPVDYSVLGSARAAQYAWSEWMRLVVGNAEQFGFLLLVLALAVKYLFYEDVEDSLPGRQRKPYIEELERKFEEESESESAEVSDTHTSHTSELSTILSCCSVPEMDRSSNSTDEGISLSVSQTLSRRVSASNLASLERRMSVERRLSSSAKAMLPNHRERVTVVVGDDSYSESNWSDNIYDNKDVSVQTEVHSADSCSSETQSEDEKDKAPRDVSQCLNILKSSDGAEGLSDEEIMNLVRHKHIVSHQLEKALGNPLRGVHVRRKILSKQAKTINKSIENLPYKHYDYTKIMGACCENVVGYMPVPVGVVGPLNIDGREVHIPMATTEGCLVASTNRGCRALKDCGVKTAVTYDGMSRGPVIRFPSMSRAACALKWMEDRNNFKSIKEHFDSTSRFARLQKLHIRIAGRQLYIRFVARTGDAMGMNMLSKATEFSVKRLLDVFPDMEIVSLSGNFCTDKKPAAVNWVEGRGKSVVAEAIVPASVVRYVLKTSTSALVDLNISKNLIGSSMAGSIGGFNAHAANIITALYIATGQDAAQNVGSSNCITLMEPWGERGEDLYMTCSMPSIEVGTVGGGTFLPAQASCLEMLGVKGSHPDMPGENASQLARIVCGTVLAGELSLMSALAAGHLVRSHLKHNRSSVGALVNGPAGFTQEFGVIRPIVSSTPVPGVIGESREEINLEINGINGTLTNGTGLDKKKYNKCGRGDL